VPDSNKQEKQNPSASLRTKYIFVSGGVISGIGKGITSASISLLLKSAGYIVAPIKFVGGTLLLTAVAYLFFTSGFLLPG